MQGSGPFSVRKSAHNGYLIGGKDRNFNAQTILSYYMIVFGYLLISCFVKKTASIFEIGGFILLKPQ